MPVRKKIGFIEAFSIGVGGMIGGGIFAVLGLTAILTKGAAPIAFLLAGLIALTTAYSYAKLSVRFPSEGGTIEFIIQAFGPNLFSSWLNSLLLASYIIMLSLYAYAFGSYGSVLLTGAENPLIKKLLIAGVLIFFTLINLFGAYLVGKAEDIMVAFKVFILLLFSIFGFMTINYSHLALNTYPNILHIVTGGLIIFLAYEGFELIANTAHDIKEPEKNLPKAFFSSVIFVIFIYVLVSLVAVGNLTPQQILIAKDYVLAEAAKPFLGQFGFIMIGIAAIISTASAINATLYGTARISYLVAKYGELPQAFTKQIWKGAYEGLIILSTLTLIAALSFNLENISVAGSVGFLLVFAAVNIANFRLASKTRANRFIAGLGALGCLVSAIVLVEYTLKTNPKSLYSSAWIIVGTLIFELIYQSIAKRSLSPYLDWRLKEREQFLSKLDYYLPKIINLLKQEIKQAEIYILEEIASSNKEATNKLHLGIKTTSSPKKSAQYIQQKIKTKLNLKDHHPLKISFIPEDKTDQNAIKIKRYKRCACKKCF